MIRWGAGCTAWLAGLRCRCAMTPRNAGSTNVGPPSALPAALVHPWTGMTYRRSSTRRLTVCPSDTASRSCSATSKR